MTDQKPVQQTRTRRLRLIALVAGVVVLGPCAYVAVIPPDLFTPLGFGSPESCMKTYYRAIEQRRWSDAAACLSAEYRTALKGPIEDRRFFDCYSLHGLRSKHLEPIMRGYASTVRIDDASAVVLIDHRHPWLPSALYGVLGIATARSHKALVTEDGQWRITLSSTEGDESRNAAERFGLYYQVAVPNEARGWAKRNEDVGR